MIDVEPWFAQLEYRDPIRSAQGGISPKLASMEFYGNLAHQIVLLSIKPNSGRVRSRSKTQLAATGAVLAELAMQERVGLVGKKVHLFDPRPVDDPMLDSMLRVLGTHPDRRPTRIIQDGGKFYLEQAVGDMLRAGWIVQTDPGGPLGARYQVVNVPALTTAHEVASAAIHDPVRATARAACLGGLVLEVMLGKKLVPDMGWQGRWQSQRILCKRDWVVKAVREIIQSQQAAASA